MTMSTMKGQVKEATGKLTGDKGMQAEGVLEQGVAHVKGAVVYVTDTIAAGAKAVVRVMGNALDGVQKTIKKIF